MSRLQQLGRRVFVWQQLSYILFFARSILLMRLLSPEAFGAFVMASTLASYISILRAFDFRAPLIAAKALNPRLLSTQFSMELGLCGLNLLVSLLLAPWIGGHYGTVILGVMLGLLFSDAFDSMYSTPIYLSERNLLFPLITRAKAIINLACLAVCVGMAWKGYGVWALLADRMIAALLMGIIIWKQTDWKLSFSFDSQSFRYLAKFGGVLFCCGMLGKVMFGFDLFMLGTYWSTEELGYYSRAITWARLPMDVGSGFLSMMALAFYSEGARGSAQFASDNYSEMTFQIARSSMWMVGVIAILFWDLVPLIFGSKWISMIPFFWMLLPYAIARPLFQNSTQFLVSLHDQKFILGTMAIFTLIYALLILACVGHSALWVAGVSGAALVGGYVLLERRINRKLGGHAWKTILSPLWLLLLALLGAGIIRYFDPHRSVSLTLNILLALSYSTATFLEWRRNNRKKPLQRPIS